MWLLLASSAASKCCWCDADTPKAAQRIQSADGVEHELVFSDELTMIDEAIEDAQRGTPFDRVPLHKQHGIETVQISEW